jgi:two-component system, chemotaxis family, chemotaxis protein CheY
MSKRVLIIDDSAFMRDFIEEALTEQGWEVVGLAEDGDSGIEMALSKEPDLITLDNVLPDMLGLDIAKILKLEEEIGSKIIMISALKQDSVIEESKACGVEDYISKPFSKEVLLEKVNKLF